MNAKVIQHLQELSSSLLPPFFTLLTEVTSMAIYKPLQKPLFLLGALFPFSIGALNLRIEKK